MKYRLLTFFAVSMVGLELENLYDCYFSVNITKDINEEKENSLIPKSTLYSNRSITHLNNSLVPTTP